MTSVSAKAQFVTMAPHKDIFDPEGGGASCLTHLQQRPLLHSSLFSNTPPSFSQLMFAQLPALFTASSKSFSDFGGSGSLGLTHSPCAFQLQGLSSMYSCTDTYLGSLSQFNIQLLKTSILDFFPPPLLISVLVKRTPRAECLLKK